MLFGKSMKTNKFVKHDLFLTNPCWEFFFTKLRFSICLIMLSLIIDSNTLHINWPSSWPVDNLKGLVFYPFYRAMLCIRGTSHGPVSVCVCVCLCLCPSVTSRCSTKTAKRRITQTTNTRYPRDSSFLMPKTSAKFDRGHPLRGRRMQVGWVKIGDVWLITGYISKTVQDRRMVSIKVE